MNITIKRNDINEYIDFVKSKYPEAVIDYWFEHGELIFYKHPRSDIQRPSSCCKRDGKLIIVDDF